MIIKDIIVKLKKKRDRFISSLPPLPSLLFLSFVFHHFGFLEPTIYILVGIIINFCQKSWKNTTYINYGIKERGEGKNPSTTLHHVHDNILKYLRPQILLSFTKIKTDPKNPRNLSRNLSSFLREGSGGGGPFMGRRGSRKTGRNLRARINFNRVINAAHRHGKIWIEHAAAREGRAKNNISVRLLWYFESSIIVSSFADTGERSRETPNTYTRTSSSSARRGDPPNSHGFHSPTHSRAILLRRPCDRRNRSLALLLLSFGKFDFGNLSISRK